VPYLTPERKAEIDSGFRPTTKGDLTYLITRALLGDPEEATLEEALQAAVERYFERRQVDFGLLFDIMGGLDCAGREYRRRRPALSADDVKMLSELEWFATDFYDNVIAPYEDTKIEQNGDVYENA
jgi:hypothetical protein